MTLGDLFGFIGDTSPEKGIKMEMAFRYRKRSKGLKFDLFNVIYIN
jgi:hypothetical protein